MANYTIWLDDIIGNKSNDRNLSNFLQMEYTRIENNYGALTLLTPATFDRRALVVDARMEVIRSANGKSKLDTDTIWFLQDWVEMYSGNNKFYQLTAVDSNHILSRHAIPYAAESSYTKKTTYTDNMIKAIFRENLGSLAKVATEVPPTTADTGRDLSTYITIEADTSRGPSITKSFANAKTVLEAMNDIALASAQNGTELFFDIVAIDAKTLVFKTFITYRGVDRTLGNIIFSPQRGTLFDAKVTTAYTKEINYVYAKGQGQGAERTIVTSSDTARIAKSMFNRREMLIDGRDNSGGTTALQSDADAQLYAGRPTIQLEATLKDSDSARYGVDWNFGDYIPVSVGDYRFNAHVRAVNVKVANGKEDISATIKGVL